MACDSYRSVLSTSCYSFHRSENEFVFTNPVIPRNLSTRFPRVFKPIFKSLTIESEVNSRMIIGIGRQVFAQAWLVLVIYFAWDASCRGQPGHQLKFRCPSLNLIILLNYGDVTVSSCSDPRISPNNAGFISDSRIESDPRIE